MRDLLRACDVLNRTLPDGAAPLTDGEIFVVCEVCGDIPLNTLFLTLKREIVYTCPTTLEPMVILAMPNGDDAAWNRAHRVGDFAIWHSGDLHFRGTRIPRSELALREIRARYTKERRKQKRQ
jgi:hypothetical protein